MFTVWEPAIPFATPRATPSIPSVAMNGTTRRRVIARPFIRPTRPPTKMPIKMAEVVGFLFTVFIVFRLCDLVEVVPRETNKMIHEVTRKMPDLFQILLKRRMQQRLSIGSIQIVRRDHGDPGINSLIDRLSLQTLDHRAHPEIAHVEWILHDDPVQLFGSH